MKTRFWSWMGSHPQRFMLKKLCKLIYYVGFGDCWYEETRRSRLNKILYMIWSIIVHTYIIAFLIDEICACFRTTLSVKERNDWKQYIVGHSTIYVKTVIFYFQRNRIRAVLEKLVEDKREVYMDLDIDKASVKKAFIYCIFLALFTYNTVGTALIESIIRYYVIDGTPIRVEVTYYPPPNVTGKYVNILRIFVELHYWYVVTAMIIIEALCYCSLIFIEHKFILLQSYFKHLRTKFLENPEGKTRDELEEEMNKNFFMGIRLHENALWCATGVQATLGNIYSVQLIQNTVLLSNCFFRFVTLERDMSFILSNTWFVATLVYLTATYMMSSGDITWEASNVSEAIYDSGWELCSQKAGLRTLAVVAIQRSQVPVYMTAFSVVILSYSNFVSFLRLSYSFFAVMY